MQIADILTEHASCSKQHAVLQFRLVALKSKNSNLAVGEKAKRVVKYVVCAVPPVGPTPCRPHAAACHPRPYIMDLQSSNGTFLNGKRIEDSRYVLHGACKQICVPSMCAQACVPSMHVRQACVRDTFAYTTRYYELRARDQLKFGASTREYILLHDDLVKG